MNGHTIVGTHLSKVHSGVGDLHLTDRIRIRVELQCCDRTIFHYIEGIDEAGCHCRRGRNRGTRKPAQSGGANRDDR